MIDNSPDAVPQSGLDLADWVFEVEAEGGITRFLAGFYRQPVSRIGPIRSTRFYFLHLLHPFRGPVAHAGGNPDALDMLARNPVYQDMDEIYNAGAYFWRSDDRDPPHNLYTSTELLLRGAREKGYRLLPLPTSETTNLPPGSPARQIHVTFPMDYTQVEWVAADGRWQRHQNNTLHQMQDHATIRPETVVVLVASHYRTEFSGEWQRDVGVIGQGTAWYFRSGQVWTGTWKKPAPDQDLAIMIGNTQVSPGTGPVWVQIVATQEAVGWSE